jgi:hypothetical protein
VIHVLYASGASGFDGNLIVSASEEIPLKTFPPESILIRSVHKTLQETLYQLIVEVSSAQM